MRTADVNGRDVEGKLNPRLEKLVERLKLGQEIQRLSQAYISPTLVNNLVDGIMEIVNNGFDYRGILHIAGSQRISYYEFARELAKFINADDTLVKADKSKVWDISLDTNFTKSLLQTKLLNVEDQFKKIFS